MRSSPDGSTCALAGGDEALPRSRALQQARHQPHSGPVRLARTTVGGDPPPRSAIGSPVPHAPFCIQARPDSRHRAPVRRGIRVASQPPRRGWWVRDPSGTYLRRRSTRRSSPRARRARCSHACRPRSARYCQLAEKLAILDCGEHSSPALGAAERVRRDRDGALTARGSAQRSRLGRRAGRRSARRSGGAPCIAGAAVPWADRPGAAAPAVPARSAVVHALAGPARSSQPARRLTAGQRLVAGDERAPAARRMRGDRAGWRAHLAIRRRTRFGCGCSSARPRPPHLVLAHNASIVAGYLEHEGLAEGENAPERFFMNVALVARPLRARPRRGPATRARAIRAACPPPRRSPARNRGRVPLAPPRVPTATRSRATSSGTRRRTASRSAARLRGDRAEAAAPVRVVGGGARRAAPARARSRRQPDLRVAV